MTHSIYAMTEALALQVFERHNQLNDWWVGKWVKISSTTHNSPQHAGKIFEVLHVNIFGDEVSIHVRTDVLLHSLKVTGGVPRYQTWAWKLKDIEVVFDEKP